MNSKYNLELVTTSDYVVPMSVPMKFEPINSRKSYLFDNYEVDPNYAFKAAVSSGLSNIPYAGGFLSLLWNIFWPNSPTEDIENVWEQLRDRIQDLVDASIINAVNGILDSKIKEMRDKIQDINLTIERFEYADAKDDYMNLVTNFLIGLEENFKREIEGDEWIAYAILPLLSTTVSMQMSYYASGLDYKDELGLDAIDIDKLNRNIDALYNDVSNYIQKLAAWADDDAYNNASQDNVYDEVMGARSWCVVHGYEHMLLWEEIVNKKSADVTAHSNLISYSPCIGYPTQKFNFIGTGPINEIEQPLKPKIYNGHRNRIVKIEGWNSIEIHYYNRVGRIKLTYENGDVVQMGHEHPKDENYRSIDLNGAYIKYVDVIKGDTTAVDQVAFHLSDERIFKIGEDSRREKTRLQLEGHFVAGMFADDERSDKIAAFGVSYEMLHPNM
ncbi:insecticidal delta-endotoxin Cry8Ea1 family protein [Vibrio campbellii]|uniref:insecticidal delta-endotoxin Cry8Ea1 family protein n=1 Tax=Vibrio campbellii TaxID=680 RepID=UPI0005EE7B06|nr:insecticidal delta-endotoxin Cry8Ea1 family protein [Vibrio campbellii]